MMTAFYKYMKKSRAEQFCRNGAIRISTLFDFRRQELGHGITDADEGIKDLIIDIIKEEKYDGRDVPKYFELAGLIKVDDTVTDIRFENIHIQKRLSSQNFLIFCCSMIRSPGMLKEFAGADTCIEIFDINSFIQTLNCMINYDCNFLGLHKVVYRDRTEKHSTGITDIHPALIKDVKYVNQAEVRAIWKIKDGMKLGEYRIFNRSAIGKICKIVIP